MFRNNISALKKRNSREYESRLFIKDPQSPMRHETEDLEQLVFAPSPVSLFPMSDLAIVNHGGLSSEVMSIIQSLTMRPMSAIGEGHKDDSSALDSAIPYQLNNESMLLAFYKSKGYDTDKIQQVLAGEDLDEVFTDDSAASDDSSGE